MKKLLCMVMVLAMVLSLCACGDTTTTDPSKTPGESQNPSSSKEPEASKDPASLPTVTLTVWGGEGEESQAFLKAAVEAFKEANKDKANFDIKIGAESESTVKDTVLADPEAAADVFYMADDQVAALVAAGAIAEVIFETDKVIEENGGQDSGSIKAASVDGKLYAFPATASNGYFMFYNKEYFSEDDVKSFEKMVEVAAAAGKKVSFQMDSGWYLYGFFNGAGLSATLNEDGKTNSCDWNATSGTYTGVQVAESILNLVASEGFTAASDADFQTGIAEGTIIAGVNGTWNAKAAEAAWGENYAATKLPTFNVNGTDVQMSSYAGYKLVAVSNYSENTNYAMALARFLTNYDNQVMRFEMVGEGPSNVQAASSEKVLADPATAALAAQGAYATVQRIGNNFWDPSQTLGTILAQGNPDNIDLQTLLDNAVEGITAPIIE